MSATDELRRLLDELGVEHVDEKDGKFLLVTWSHNKTSATFVEDTVSGETSIAISAIVTPEQAIAATLGPLSEKDTEKDSDGRGECHNEGDPSDFCCSELRARPRRFYVQHEARMAAIDARMRELGIGVEQ